MEKEIERMLHERGIYEYIGFADGLVMEQVHTLLQNPKTTVELMDGKISFHIECD